MFRVCYLNVRELMRVMAWSRGHGLRNKDEGVGCRLKGLWLRIQRVGGLGIRSQSLSGRFQS